MLTEQIPQSFEYQALSRLSIYQEEYLGVICEGLLNTLREAFKPLRRKQFRNSELRALHDPISNPDGIYIFGNSVIIAEMKTRFKAATKGGVRRQLSNHPHYVHAMLQELKENETLQDLLYFDDMEKDRLQQLNYDPTNPESNWLVFGRHESDPLYMERIDCCNGKFVFDNADLRITPQFRGPSLYTPISLDYINDRPAETRVHAPRFPLSENLNDI